MSLDGAAPGPGRSPPEGARAALPQEGSGTGGVRAGAAPLFAPGLARPSRALGVAAVAGVALWFAAWPHLGGADPLHLYGDTGMLRVSAAEGQFYLAGALVQALLVAWAVLAASRLRPGGAALGRAHRALAGGDGAYALLAAAAAALALLFAFTLFGRFPFTEDEKTYLFQARLLRSGRLTAPVPVGVAAFLQPFVVQVQDWLTAQYFWAHPALLAPGDWLGVPHAVVALQVAVAVLFTGKLASEYTQEPRAGLVAAGLAATSPLLLLTGATLHNSVLAAACGAVALWALCRLSRRRSTRAALALGVATGLALHNRVLDHTALMLGAGVLLLLQVRADGRRGRQAAGGLPAAPLTLRELAARLWPALLVVLPCLALHLLVNQAISGHPLRSGYWLFNDRQGWTTLGFGTGPFGGAHTPAIAAAKTVTNLLHLLFYATGSPWGPALLALPLLGVVRAPGGRLLAPLLLPALYFGAYFFYAGWSVTTTGPLYFTALVPVLAAALAATALALHRAVGAPPWGRLLVPSLLGAQLAAALLLFWPTQLLEARRVGRASGACEAVAARHGLTRALVFVEHAPVPPRSWAFNAPLPGPRFDDPLLFARSLGPEHDPLVVEAHGRGRPVYFTRCIQDPGAQLLRYEPRTGQKSPLD